MNIYLDNAATTPLAPEVYEVMAPILKEGFGNPSSSHSYGRKAKAIIETARKNIASLIHANPSEIIFTSGGTEADNMAINCAIKDLGVERIITSNIEHHAVLHTAEYVSKDLFIQLDLVRLDSKGHVKLDHLEELLKNSTKKTLVSLMHGNNEIGNLLPLEKVSEICREYGAYFHSDTVQTMGHYAFNMDKLDIDFITCAAHKFHGPKGVGFLYVNRKNILSTLIHGGAQERGHRGGTENIYGIAGLEKALEIANQNITVHQKHVQGLKSHMIKELKMRFNAVSFNGDVEPDHSLYTVLNVSFPPTPKASMLLFTLDLKGIACSGGSACSSGSNKGSHVLEGIQADPNRPNVRFSFSRYTTLDEINQALAILEEVFKNNLA